MAELSRPVLGLTGAIAAGKSAAGDLLGSMGCVVSRSDQHAHEVLRDPEVVETLVDWWGEGVLDAEGAVARPAVAERVFANPAERERLEALVHPKIHLLREACFAHATPATKALVIEAPLLFEAKMDEHCAQTIFIDASRAVRLARVAERGWDSEELDRRESAQWSLDVKRQKADYVIRNEGSLEVLRLQLETILLHLIASE
ncbi:MAG: dephospho-CoA kinase [Planctomycetota bacterium]|nr:dephospho-CoA kinase [Planctomycetota bacterium]